jgi:preprotein translocase subunit SecG
MYGLILTIHVIVCILLISIVLIQSGRGGGLIESFSSAESIFGTKTSSFLTRTTAILAVLFMTSCLSLAFLSARRSRSLMEKVIFEKKNNTLPVRAKSEKETGETPQASVGEDTAAQSQSAGQDSNTEESLPSGQ